LSRILSIDPSIRETGYSVILDDEVAEANCIKTKSGEFESKIRDRIRRLMKIYDELEDVVESYGVNEVLCEQVGGSRSASGVWSLAGSTAVVSSLICAHDLDFEFINKWTINQCLFDRRSVEKDEMVERMESEFPGDFWPQYKYQTEAVSDSLSVYYTYKRVEN
jgi:Holliday junction resolvasome RuvABC endonuclease subunit